jgi:hypothetical protein
MITNISNIKGINMFENLGKEVFPKNTNDVDKRIISINVDNNEVNVLLFNNNDHPTLLSIDIINNTYTIEGYD